MSSICLAKILLGGIHHEIVALDPDLSIQRQPAGAGLLVFGTLHTNNARKTVDRIIDVFPADQQSQPHDSARAT